MRHVVTLTPSAATRRRRRLASSTRRRSTTPSPATPFVVTLGNGQTITIPVGQSSATSAAIAVRADDAYAQGDQSVVSDHQHTGGNFEAVNTASTAAPPSPTTAMRHVTLSASAATVTEGGSIVYTATLNNAVTGSPLVVTLSNGQTITIPVGQSSGTSAAFTVRADDVYVQGTRPLDVTVTGSTRRQLRSRHHRRPPQHDRHRRCGSDRRHPDALRPPASPKAAASSTRPRSTTPSTGTPFVGHADNGQTITIPVGQSSANGPAFAVRADDAYAQGDQSVVSITGTSGGNFEAVNTTSTVSTTVTDDAMRPT